MGFLNKYPEYKTQGKTVAELEEILSDIYENAQFIEERKNKKAELRNL